MSNFNIPNAVTAVRLLIAFSVFYFLIKDNVITALVLALMFILLDALDGALARKLKQETKFGNIFDILTDSFCGIGIFTIRFFTGKIPILISAPAIINGLFFGFTEIYVFLKIKKYYVSKIRMLIVLFYSLFSLFLILNLYDYKYMLVALAGMYFASIYYFFETNKILRK